MNEPNNSQNQQGDQSASGDNTASQPERPSIVEDSVVIHRSSEPERTKVVERSDVRCFSRGAGNRSSGEK